MRTFLKQLFYFIVFSIAFFVLINVLYMTVIVSTDWDFKKRLESIKFDDPDFELLALGSSTAFDAIDTELLTLNGVKSYNLAMGGNSVRSSYFQLKEYLSIYTGKPRFILLCLSSYGEDFTLEDVHPIVEVTSVNHKYSLEDVPILKFKWLGFEFLKKIVSIQHRRAKLSYGQLKFQKIIFDDTDYEKKYLDIKKFESAGWIREIAKLCTQNEMELIIIEQPGYKHTQNLSDIGPYILNFNNGYSAPLYNFNNQDFCRIFDAERDWIGNSHLNEFGAVKLTKELIKFVKFNSTP